jgi:hypothetical protein
LRKKQAAADAGEGKNPPFPRIAVNRKNIIILIVRETPDSGKEQNRHKTETVVGTLQRPDCDFLPQAG